MSYLDKDFDGGEEERDDTVVMEDGTVFARAQWMEYMALEETAMESSPHGAVVFVKPTPATWLAARKE
jgi:hypothetical protein